MELLQRIAGMIAGSEDLTEYFSVECDFDFAEKESLQEALDYLTESTECNYTLDPFARDGAGGVYVLLNGEKVGYLDSEGQAGIVAANIKDFFSIITSCGYVGDYAKFNCLDNEKAFLSYFESCVIPRDKGLIKQFIDENALESDPRAIYEMFKNAVMTKPRLEIRSTSKDYEDYEQLFEL